MKYTKEDKDRVAKRLWGLVAWNNGINPTTDGVPITMADDTVGIRPYCKTLAQIALEEADKINKEREVL